MRLPSSSTLAEESIAVTHIAPAATALRPNLPVCWHRSRTSNDATPALAASAAARSIADPAAKAPFAAVGQRAGGLLEGPVREQETTYERAHTAPPFDLAACVPSVLPKRPALPMLLSVVLPSHLVARVPHAE